MLGYLKEDIDWTINEMVYVYVQNWAIDDEQHEIIIVYKNLEDAMEALREDMVEALEQFGDKWEQDDYAPEDMDWGIWEPGHYNRNHVQLTIWEKLVY